MQLTAAGLAADRFFCVVPRDRGGQNTCSGDSGGPVLWLHSDGSTQLVGVTSAGKGCGADSVGFVSLVQG
jgi:secreted trypsin-like serine protease